MEITRSVPFKVVRSAEDGDGLTLTGYAAVFNSITRIRGEQPREFDEQIARGAFNQSINSRLPVLQFDHGQHPSIGSVPIGAITELHEDARGLFVEARLFDNDLVKPVRQAIEAGSISGMSFRFSVPKGKDSWDRSGEVPLRTIHEVRCAELGPVVFPAYADTSVGVRSDSDVLAQAREFLISLDDETREGLLADITEDAPASVDPDTRDEAAEGTSVDEPSSTAEPLPDGTPQTAGERARVLRSLLLQGVLT